MCICMYLDWCVLLQFLHGYYLLTLQYLCRWSVCMCLLCAHLLNLYVSNTGENVYVTILPKISPPATLADYQFIVSSLNTLIDLWNDTKIIIM